MKRLRQKLTFVAILITSLSPVLGCHDKSSESEDAFVDCVGINTFAHSVYVAQTGTTFININLLMKAIMADEAVLASHGSNPEIPK
jgi:hypothetical protein